MIYTTNKILMVTYELKNKVRDTSPIVNILKTAPQWARCMESTWLILTNESPQDWYNKLLNALYQDDHILIMEVQPNYFGLLSPEIWTWIDDNFKKR